jgi:signal transduction histidine kinase
VKNLPIAQYFQRRVITPCLLAWQRRSSHDLIIFLEWLFLLGAILPNIVLPLLAPSWLHIPFGAIAPPWQVMTIILFGAMGFRRPRQNLRAKKIYTIAELMLVYVPVFLAPGIPYIAPPLHLIIVIRSCFIFGRLGQFITTLVSYGLFSISMVWIEPGAMIFGAALPKNQVFNMMWLIRLNGVFAILLISLFILVLINTLFSIQRSRHELAQAHDQLRHYALRIENQAMLQERNRIAHEMHDALGHALTAQSLQLETVQYFWHSDIDKASRSLSQAKQLGSQALNDLRQVVSVLRADPLQGLSLEEAIAKLIQTFHQATGVLPSCTFRLDGVVPVSVKSCIYRVMQEALTNIAKHSQATEVSLYLQVTSEQLNILIQDNGIGFEPDQTASGFGLQGMKERIIASGGLFSLVSQSGLGCKVMAQIPLTKVEFT